ncbi:MAG TPA: cell division protein SepF [Sporosarcina sp.]|nr:cell division protein SepF [Sporosarcina sp.]
MSLKEKIQNWFYLDEEEEMEENMEQSKQKEKQVPVKKERQRAVPEAASPRPKRPVKKRQSESSSATTQSTPRIVSLQSAKNTSKVVLSEPRVYDEAQDISEHLKNKRAVIVNLQRIDRDQAIRIIDFLSGTVYALGGDIQRVGTDIFLCVPENVEVAGEITDYFD